MPIRHSSISMAKNENSSVVLLFNESMAVRWFGLDRLGNPHYRVHAFDAPRTKEQSHKLACLFSSRFRLKPATRSPSLIIGSSIS